MSIYHVQSEDDLGGRRDLIVKAPCPDGAVIMWREHYDLPVNVDPDKVFEMTLPFGHGPLERKVCEWIS
jgi:hypothetical protein